MAVRVFCPASVLHPCHIAHEDRAHRYVVSGREAEYHGIAVHPRHLSLWERWVQRRSDRYDPVADRAAKVTELRQVYEQMRAERGKEFAGESEGVDPDEASFISDDVAAYFDTEKGVRNRAEAVPAGSGNSPREKAEVRQS